ncbi:phage tail tape measure protein [Metapseudomonas otitidis]|uniref:phage tail tape measure protein n=1 Tax=Metapseudomonas otitidis TaxID=319939 RepID=UPI0008E67DBB|nr:phage tail tape measure protein [Pseudomonas otitidis]SFA47636.1 phage tail tape measure protein, TP901 family, core region [Pseudomonas otitidis]
MSSDMSIGIVIGGAVSAALRNSIKDATKSLGQLGQEIEATSKKGQLIDGFNKAKESAKAASAEFFANKKRVEDLNRAVTRAGQPVKALDLALAQAQRALERSKRSMAAQTTQVNNYRRELQAAGIDVRNLAKEQERLAGESARLQRMQKAQARADDFASRRTAVRGEGLGLAAEAATVGYAIKAAVDPAVRLETALKKVEARVDFSSPQGIVDLRTQLEALSEETGIMVPELAEAAALAGQFGIAGDKVAAFVKQATQVGVAFDMSSAQATEAISTLSTVLGIPIDKTGTLLDAVNQLANNSKASEAQILDVLGRVGGIGKQFGLANTQIAALASTFISLGKSPEVAATGINALLNKLQTAGVQSDEFKTELQNLVGDVDAFTRSMDVDAQAALDNFLAQLGKLDTRGQAEAITVLFGQEYADDISLLSGSLAEYRKQLSEVADETKYAGSVQREFERFNSGAAVEVRKATTGLNNAFAQLGEAALPVITKISRQVADLAKWLKSTGDTGQSVLMGLAYLLGGGLLLKGVRFLGRLIFTEIGGAFTAVNKVATKVMGEGLVSIATQSFRRIGAEAQGSATIATRALAGIQTAARGLTWALGVVGAAFAGWEIGTYLRKEVLWIERLGIALASQLHAGFVLIRGYAEESFEGLKFALSNPLDYMRLRFANFVKDLATLIAKIPTFGESAASALRAAADSVTGKPATLDNKGGNREKGQSRFGEKPGAIESFSVRQEAIRKKTQDEVKAIKDGYFELWEMAGQNADKTKEANAGAAQAQKELADATAASQEKMTADAAAGTKQRISLTDKEKAALKKAVKERDALMKDINDRTKNIIGEKGLAQATSFSQAGGLTAKARQSLQNKDYLQALKYADQATEVLEELQKSGDRNTLALAGQAKAAQRIAEEAYAAIDAAGKAATEKVAKVPVKPVMDDAAVEQAKAAVQALAETLRNSLVITITPIVSMPDGVANPSQPFYKDGSSFTQFPNQGFSAGGFTGFGGRLEPAGIVHRGEYVMPQPVVREPGAISVLSAMRTHGVSRVLEQVRKTWRGYDVGGLVGDYTVRPIPQVSGMSPPAASFPNLGLLEISVGGAPPIRTYAEPSMAEQLRRTAMKFGRP